MKRLIFNGLCAFALGVLMARLGYPFPSLEFFVAEGLLAAVMVNTAL